MRPLVITVFDSEVGTTTDHNFVSSPVRIGRNPLNDLPLPFPFVSGWHAVVRFDDGQSKFFDLGSTNGTLLNGRKIQAGEAVVIGEILSVTIGKLELRFRRGDAVSSLHPAGYAASPVASVPTPNPMPAPRPTPASVGPSRGRAATPMPMSVDRRPSQQIAVGAPPSTAHVQVSDVHDATARLRPAYDAYRQAWTRVSQELQASLSSMHPSMQEFAVSMFVREYPQLAKEPEFDELARRLGVRSPATPGEAVGAGAGRSRADDAGAVARLAKGVRPEEEPPRTHEETQRFLACVEDVLRASAKAFVELQKGQEQFGREMGVRTIKEFTPLHAAGTPENVLRYLLDWQKGGPHRTQELVGVYADLMIHQVALINGVVEGVRSLLAHLDPMEIERGVTSAWGSRSASAWKAFVQRYQELTEADRNITERVFGPEFARAYAEVGGEGSRG